MQRTPPTSPPGSPTPGSSKGKGIGKGASNKPPNPKAEERVPEFSDDDEPGDVLFDNKYAKSTLEDIKISWNGASRGYGKAKKKFTGFIPHFAAPFNMEIAASMRELIENLTNFYRTLELTADAASIIYQHEILSERLQGLEKDHNDMLAQLHKYVNSLSSVKSNSTLNQRLANQLVVDNLPHPVLAFKPKPLSKDSTPDEFAIWKDNFEVYFTASNAHNCDTKIQSVFLNTCIDEFLVSTLKKRVTDGMPVFGTSDAIPGHIQLLEQHFLTRFPIHIRRAEIFLFKPDDKMKPSQYFSHMIQKINEAELLQTPVHDIMTSFLATNCPDAQLRLELLRSDYVSLNGMVNRALTYEQAQSVFKKPTEEVNAVQARKRSQYQQGKRNKNQPSTPPAKGKSTPTKKKCPGCDSEKHERKDCPHKDKICSFCKIKGHIETACRKKKAKDKDGTAHYVEEECQNAQIEYCSGTASPTPPLYL